MQLIQTPNSSSIAAFGFGIAQSKTNEKRIGIVLTIVFHTGKMYNYHNVPMDLYDKMQKADSVGQFFNKEIKGKFKHEFVGGVNEKK